MTLIAVLFAYVSLDNLDFLIPHRKIRSTGQISCVNCTTYMAGQPRPNGLPLAPEELITVEAESSACREKSVCVTSSRDRRLSADLISSQSSGATFIVNSDMNEEPTITCEDFKISDEESAAFSKMSQSLFTYNVCKSAQSSIEEPFIYPILKVFLSKQCCPEEELSKFSYIGLLNETCDSKETVLAVLRIIYNKMEIGKKFRYCLVVGDGKTFDYLIKLKDEYKEELQFCLNFPGDWHILRNTSLALMKLYGPAGLFELAQIYHHGRTEKLVVNSTDFDKTFEFYLQTWEAMYRHQIDLFFNYLQHVSENETLAIAKFSKMDFFQDICNRMTVWKNSKVPFEQFFDSAHDVEQLLGGNKTDFEVFTKKVCAVNELFSFWHTFIHEHCMAYITLYLSGRSGNWNLRMHSLKMLMPLFHLTTSTFYYRLLPRHLHDLQKYPKCVLDHLKKGGFVMSLGGTAWSNLFLDETHETTINLQCRQVIRSLSNLSILTKLHYIPYRASAHKQFLDLFYTEKDQHLQRKDNSVHSERHKLNVKGYMASLAPTGLFSIAFDKLLSKEVKPLFHIFSKEVASQSIRDSLLSFHKLGNERLQLHVKCFLTHELTMRSKQKRPYKFTPVKNFGVKF